MLSVCIPVYNQEVSELTNALHEQAERLGTEAEILLLDDASEAHIKEANQKLSALPLVRYEELRKNVGRSRIRNILGQKAKYPLLLFLDCDVSIIRDDFLQRYVEAGKDGSVVCGGHIYQGEPPSHKYRLHWLSGKHRETKPASQRQKKPHMSFMTASFLLPAGLLYDLPFNEELNGYGHEDTLYGYQLFKRKIAIKHIDNPVLHHGLEPAPLFLEKTQNSMKNLRKVFLLTAEDPAFLEMAKVLKMCDTLEKKRLKWLFRVWYRLFAGCIQCILVGRYPKLWLYDLYKLGTICR